MLHLLYRKQKNCSNYCILVNDQKFLICFVFKDAFKEYK